MPHGPPAQKGVRMKAFFVYMTAPSKEEAERICSALIEERLAACANILPGASSVYWWEGKVETANEAVCILKTTAAVYHELERRAVELHPYKVPCVVALKLENGHAPFLEWVGAETK